jgi:hypothetical protein
LPSSARSKRFVERVERPRSAAPCVSLPELSGLGHCADAAFGMPSQLPNDRACADGQGGSRHAASSRRLEMQVELIRDERWLKATRAGAKAPHGPSTPATTPPNSPTPSRALRGRWRGRERSRPSCSHSQLRKAARRAEGVLLPARAAYAPGNLPPWPPQHPQRALRPAPTPPSGPNSPSAAGACGRAPRILSCSAGQFWQGSAGKVASLHRRTVAYHA